MSEIVFECRKLTKKFGNKKALDGIDLSLSRGKIVGLLGPNGSGKTTLIKIANGLLSKSDGEVLIDGKKVSVETKKIVSYLPDKDYLPEGMKIKELVKLFADFYKDFDSRKATDIITSLGIDMNMKLKKLSKGGREKVQLALVMSRKADLYFLDEPIGGVDPVTRDYIIGAIKRDFSENSTIVIATHLISEVEPILDEVVFIKNGEIILQDSVESIRENGSASVLEKFREVFA